MSEKNHDYGIPDQIQIVAIGQTIESSDFYIQFHEIWYGFTGLLEAFECALQMHIMFKIDYQKQSAYFWTSIEQYFYKCNSTPSISSKTILMANHMRKIELEAENL